MTSITTAITICMTIGTLGFSGCSAKVDESPAQQAVSLGTVLKKEPLVDTDPENFHTVLQMENIAFDVTATFENSFQHVVIQPKGYAVNNETFTHDIKGRVVHAEIGDLNENGFPEILVYTQSTDGRRVGNVIGYSSNFGHSVSNIYFKDMSRNPKVNVGYRGHDTFAIEGSDLIQTFPIYNTEDADDFPTGGTRRIQYKLILGEASRQFAINTVSNSPAMGQE